MITKTPQFYYFETSLYKHRDNCGYQRRTDEKSDISFIVDDVGVPDRLIIFSETNEISVCKHKNLFLIDGTFKKLQ